MDVTITPHALEGTVGAVASKSVAHRVLILAALCPEPTDVLCNTTSQDIEATVRCLNALGASITPIDEGFHVEPLPVTGLKHGQTLDCGESGSTLRFLLPVVCALGAQAKLTGHGRLAERPLSPLYERLVEHGAVLSEQGSFPLSCGGTLKAGRFELPGDVSSQFISGLLMAAPIMDQPTEVIVSEPIESRPYIDLTVHALALFGITVIVNHVEDAEGHLLTSYLVAPSIEDFRSPGTTRVEGDWSNAAFWLAAGAIGGSGVSVEGLNLQSAQGDRAILGALAALGAQVGRHGSTATVTRDTLEGRTLNVSAIPDLVMPLAAAGAYAAGTTHMTGAARLRLKESDRIESVTRALAAMGASISGDDDGITLHGGPLSGGVVDAAGDHRIAMMAAIAATRADGPTIIHGAECVAKSYPGFFDDFASLGGIVEREEV